MPSKEEYEREQKESTILYYISNPVYGYYNKNNSYRFNLNISRSKVHENTYIVNIKDYADADIASLNLKAPQRNNTGKPGYTTFTVSAKEYADLLNNIVNTQKKWSVTNSENNVVDIPGFWDIPLIQSSSIKYKTQSGLELDCIVRETLRDDIALMVIGFTGVNVERTISEDFRKLKLMSSSVDLENLGLRSAIPTEKTAFYFAVSKSEERDFFKTIINNDKKWKIANKNGNIVEIPGTWSNAPSGGAKSRKIKRNRKTRSRKNRK